MNNIDPEILKQAIKGDENAFNQIVESFQQPVFNLCFRMLGNNEAAEDAAQETFWRAYQSIKKYNPDRPFGTWLMSIAAHYCIDQHRKRKLPVMDIDDYLAETTPDHNTPNPESIALQNEYQGQIQELLNGLSEMDRASIILRYWHECSEDEISQVLNISINAVKSRLHRARKKLAIVWQQNQQVSPSVERMKNGSPAF
ncbi:MAG TPA: sigma-70 family RNA polymerase sigma factor [Anaerolineaceae bacterium]|nr:sigma-70 family RNA polymerase sigma factor [Anaerolineaceae bacterium]